jgi:F-type H+-transporting ATPase subunit b
MKHGARIATALFAVLLPALVLGAEGGHPHEPHGIPWAKLIFQTINVAIFLGILARFVWPGVKTTLQSRRTEVVDLLEKAAKAKAESERLQKEWQARLANLESELDQLRRQAKADISAERDRILAAAKQVADSIRRDAERAAEQEVRSAEAKLRQEVAAQALAVARRLAGERVRPDDQRRFVAEFLEQVRQ